MRLEGEEVKAVALGAAWVAAVTSLNYLRIFTEGGLQVCRIFTAYLGAFSLSEFLGHDTSPKVKELWDWV